MDPTGAIPSVPADREMAYRNVVHRACRYLDQVLPDAELHAVCCESLGEVPKRITERAGGGFAAADALALTVVCLEPGDPDGPLAPGPIDEQLAALREDLAPPLLTDISPYTVVVYGPYPDPAVWASPPYARRELPAQDWVLTADLVAAFTDFVQMRYTNPTVSLAADSGECLLARMLCDFLTADAGSRWGLHSYTGSVVCALIEDLEQMARSAGNPVLRGPSEHSLACGALARWQLDAAPFLITVTSGMVDEFRGTLANLREARARGFLLFAEAPPNRWFPFQGTISASEDARELFHARRIPITYLRQPASIASDLAGAFAAYTRGGPVALLATPAVLEYRGRPAITVGSGALAHRSDGRTAAGAPRIEVIPDPIDAVAAMVNEEPTRLLWQCGALDDEAVELTYDIARRAGVALADSITRPGTVARYHHGARVEEYLGTLGEYGYSARIYDFLHCDGKVRPRSEQCLFFLASRISEMATPFSERALHRALRVGQVTHDPTHLAPFDVLAELPILPMSPNYFFHRLGGVVDDLITQCGYSYTGVYDVGRGGISAIRNVPRTGRGFSGWYGRALMGDALESVVAVALTRPGNVLAFVGDGAAALVPDILPSLVHQAGVEGRPLRGNLSIFRLINGAHSVIRTYREANRGAPSGPQTVVLSLVDEDWHRSFGHLEIHHRRLPDVADDALRQQLLAAGTVNLYSVLLSHNNEGDGMGLMSSLGWQRDDLPPLAVQIAKRRGRGAQR
jgi:hypothetical protein